MVNLLEKTAAGHEAIKPVTSRPLVTLSYAQSLDGSIAKVRGNRLPMSCPESLVTTHKLRAAHDAVLVGIGTVLADNPYLTVRFVKGENPCPIVLDTHLRTPVDANLFQTAGIQPVIACIEGCDHEKQKELENAGARVVSVPGDYRGWVDLGSLMKILPGLGIQSVMVEGGARVITSFLSEHLVNQLAVTISPKLLGGLHAVESPLFSHAGSTHNGKLPVLSNTRYEPAGQDIIFLSDISWETN